MSIVKRDRAIEVLAGSGMLRVTINPKPTWLEVLVEAIKIALVSSWVVRGWASFSLVYKAFFAWVAVSTLFALLYQFSGFEVIEINRKNW